MKLLIFTQHFPPETAATGRRAFDLAESLAKGGHRVTVITGIPNHPSSLTRPFCQATPRVQTAAAGYKIVRVPVFRSADTRTLNRFFTYATFALSAAWTGIRQEPPDVIAAVSPLPAGLAAMLVHWWQRVPLIFDLQDIWPDSALAVGVMKDGRVLRALRRLEKFFYGRCERIVGISEGFRRYLLNLGAEPDRVAVIPNGVDWEMFAEGKGNQGFVMPDQSHGKFIVGYAGNVGLAQGLGTLLDAAESLGGEPVEFVLVGEGADKRRLQVLSRVRGLANVRFFDGVPREQVASVLAACDALLLILRDEPLFEITIPSKLYEYMAAGKPVICSAGGETASLVASCGCGLRVAPASGAELAGAVRKLRKNPELCRRMGETGMRCAREQFSQARLMEKYADLAGSVACRVRQPHARSLLPALKALSSRKP